jgi:hypothetical protein
MRILFIHADRFTYEATEKTKYAEEAAKDELKGSFEDSLVSFISAEKSDEADVAAIAVKAADEIEDVAGQLKATRVVLYPYAHLSSSLARPEKARLIFERLEGAVRDRGLTVHRSPFGWYKAFDIAAKGHPLSELSREVTLEEDEVAAAEERPHEFFVLTVDGKEREPKKYTSGREAFDVMVRKEALKEEYPSAGEPGYHRLTRSWPTTPIRWSKTSTCPSIRYAAPTCSTWRSRPWPSTQNSSATASTPWRRTSGPSSSATPPATSSSATWPTGPSATASSPWGPSRWQTPTDSNSRGRRASSSVYDA